MKRTLLVLLALSLLLASFSIGVYWVPPPEPDSTGGHREGLATPTRIRASRAQHLASNAHLTSRMAYLRSQLSGAVRHEALLEFLLGLAETDPALAVELAATLTPEEGRDEALHECLPHLFAADPEGARDFVLDAEDTLLPEVSALLTRELAGLDPALALTIAVDLPVGTRASVERDVLSVWTATDPQAASAAAEKLVRQSERENAVAEVGRLWAERNPAAAYAWASKLADPATQRAALEPALRTWAEHDPAQAAKALASVSAEAGLNRLVDAVAVSWAKTDAEAAFRWVQTLPTGASRESAASSLFGEMIASQPERAASFSLALFPADHPVLDRLMAAWCARDARAAMRWATGIKSESARRTVAALVLTHWQSQDDAAAQGWVVAHGMVQ